MPQKVLEEALVNFLKSPTPQAIAMSGKWGRGKTYFWRKLIERSAESATPASHYAYVSLFGIPSLQDFKLALFAEAVPLPVVAAGVSALNGDTGAKHSTRVLEWARRFGRKGASVAQEAPLLEDFAPVFRAIAFAQVKNHLIVIDDIERHSTGLSIKDVLGLVSMLREERNCRILIILNADALADGESAEFDTLREKVFDYEVTFAPSTEECVNIVFDGKHPYHESARASAMSLGIQNLRVLARARRLIELLTPHLEGLEPTVFDQVIQTAMLATWAHNEPNGGGPTLDYIKRLNYGSFIDFGKFTEPTEGERRWNEMLRDFGYMDTDDLDLAICESVQHGFPDIDVFISLARARHDAALRASREAAYHDAWDLFHSGFGDNLAEIKAAFRSAFLEGAQWISTLNAAATTQLLRDLGDERLADELMDHWIVIQLDHDPARLDLSGTPFRSEIRDEKFAAALDAISRSAANDPSLLEVLVALAGRNGWSPVDVRVMTAATEDDYYQAFTSESPIEANSLARTCLQFGQFENGSAELRSIAEKARRALLRIGSESALNARRVRALGVSLDGQSS